MKAWLIAPIAIPLVSAALGVLTRGRPRVQAAIGVGGAAALLGAALALLATVRRSGVVALQVGGWPAPYGITLVADLFSAVMVVLAGALALAVTVYSLRDVDAERVRLGYFPLLHVLLMGVCGAFLTGDLFNLYVWFEVMLLGSFVLLALGGERRQLEGGVVYVSLNLLSSALFLAALGILYGKVGTLNMADLAVKLDALGPSPALTTVSALLLVAFGIKAAVFPLFFWLPPAYPTPPAAVSAIFAGLLTKVGVYALIRVFTLIFVQDVGFTHGLLLGTAGFTMACGVLGAAAQGGVRRILSFHIVSQIGYMVLGLALFTPLALAGAIFYVVHHIVTKTNLFLVAGLVARAGGGEELARIGGLQRARPGLALLFAIPALSLAGVPPLSGFFAKLLILRAGLDAGAWVSVVVALAVGLLTLFSMTKIWSEAFWKAAPEGAAGPATGAPLPASQVLPCAALGLVTLGLGLGAAWLLELSGEAARQLLEREAYLSAVLGAGS